MSTTPVALAQARAAFTRIEAIQTRVTEFNIFDLLGTSHLELAHSRILAFLLDPKEVHGFGPQFGRALLNHLASRNAVGVAASLSFGTEQQNSVSFDEVRREDRNIDILAIDHTNHVVLLIENKVHSSEHSNQLQRYRQIVESQFPVSEWAVVPLFLTRIGERPSDAAYSVLDYHSLAHLTDTLLQENPVPSSEAVRITLEHYGRMVRRRLVTDHDAAAEAKRLYNLAPAAFEFIVSQKYYPRDELARLISRVVSETPLVIKEDQEDFNPPIRTAYVRFSHPTFERLGAVDPAPGINWTTSHRILLFQFDITERSVILGLIVGPGPSEDRERLLSIARDAGAPFDLSLRIARAGNREWRGIYEYELLSEYDFDDLDFSRLEERFRSNWDAFLASHLPTVLLPFDLAIEKT